VEDAEPIFLNFLKLLVENHRMPAIFRIRRAYDALWEEHNKLLPVAVTSAVELDEETVRHIGDSIAEQTGRRVELSSSVEPDILGGIVVRVGNQVLDASIRNRLESLRKQVVRS
jgi:ATP synthase F1 delta subunit